MSELITTKQDQQAELVKQLGLTKALPEEVNHFFAVAKQLQLDPLSKQIYAIPYGNKLTIMTSIDGARAIATRTKEYAGVDVPEFSVDDNGKPHSCTITVYRIVQGVRCGFSHKAYFSEYNTGQNLWAKKPLTMLAKVAEMGALRKAFPVEFSKIYESAEISEPQAAHEVVETVNNQQATILHKLTMLLSPNQDEAIAFTRVSKNAAADYEDLKILGAQRVEEKYETPLTRLNDDELLEALTEIEDANV